MLRNYLYKSGLRQLSKCILVCATVLLGSAAQAQTKISIEGSSGFENRQLKAGLIRVSVSYQKQNETGDPNLSYQIFYNDALKVENKVYTQYVGSVALRDLDADGKPEIVVQSFSGGAHCCTHTTIYGFDGDRVQTTETGPLNSSGGEFKDLDGDRTLEFVTVDNAFLYAFSSYAGSFPPDAIFAYQNGKLVDVTRRYPKLLRGRLWEMFKAVRRSQKEDYEVNGVLAGYVAQKILVGEYEQGWAFMLANYDRNPKGFSGFDNQDNQDFPTVLKKFLIERGYLDPQGRPISAASRG
jgi:hypothetical protein